MLRKKEKKAISSIFALLIGWPIGLDQFLEGKGGRGVLITIGWTITFLFTFFSLVNLNLGGDYTDIGIGLLVLSLPPLIVGGLLGIAKLLKLLKAFVAAED